LYSNLTHLASSFLTIIIAIAPFSSKMPKTGPKLKNASQPRYNSYKYQIPSLFLSNTNAFLQAARSQDSIKDSITIATVTNSVNRGMSHAYNGRQPVQLVVLYTRI
jgi:hypothetical protein